MIEKDEHEKCMDYDDLVKRLQTGHDSQCAMSYGMHEHCCDCSYPDRQESAETILKLRQDLAAAREDVAELDKHKTTLIDAVIVNGKRAERAEADLAAARALLSEAQSYIMSDHEWWDKDLYDRIDAALAGKKND